MRRCSFRRAAGGPGRWLAAGVLLTGTAAADVVTEEQFTAGIPTVISATRLSQPTSDTPASVTVIDREMIEAAPVVEIADLLRFVPGFQVAHARGNKFAVAYHGFADAWPRRLQVLVDGRSVYIPLISNVDWSNLGITRQDIERIEVIRGPNAVAYGANAFTAAINIVTRQPFEDRGAMVSGTVGAIDTQNATARVAGSGESLDYRLTASYRSDDGFEGVDDHKRVRTASLRMDLNPSFRDSVTTQLGYSGGAFGTWGEPDDAGNPVREHTVDSHYGLVHWQHTVSPEERFHLQFYHNRYKSRDQYSVGLLSEYLGVTPATIPAVFGHPDQEITFGQYDGEAQRYDLEFEYVFAPGPGWRTVWGGSARLDRMRSRQLLDRSDFVEDRSRRAFVNAEWRARPTTVVNAGVMAEWNDLVGSYTSSRLGVNQHLTSRHMVRASVSHTARTPSMYERYVHNDAEFADGDDLAITRDSLEDLDPERIRSYEIGYLGEFPRLDASLDLKAFREEIRDIIGSARDETYQQPFPILNDSQDVLVYQNLGEADIKGVEGQLSYEPGSSDRLELQYGYAEIEGRVKGQTHPTEYRDLEDRVARHTASALYLHRFPDGLEGSMAYYYMSAMEWSGDGEPVPGYSRLDLRLAQSLQPEGVDGKVELIVHNLLDEYSEFREDNRFGMRGYLRVTLNL